MVPERAFRAVVGRRVLAANRFPAAADAAIMRGRISESSYRISESSGRRLMAAADAGDAANRAAGRFGCGDGCGVVCGVRC